MSRPSLDLSIEVTTPSGTRFRWEANQPPDSRPRNLSFATKIGEGFSNGSVSLPRLIDRDYPDLDLAFDVTASGADGSVAYQGRIEAMPRTLDAGQSIGVSTAGWMAHARDKPFAKIYVDRDLSAWSVPTLTRRANNAALNRRVQDASNRSDPTNNDAGVVTGVQDNWVAPYIPWSEAWYDAGPNCYVNSLNFSWRILVGINSADANWNWLIGVSGDPEAAAAVTTANLRAAGPVNLQAFDVVGAYRYAVILLFYNAAPGGAAGSTFELLWKKLAVYGDHAFPRYTGMPGEPPGVLVSDVIKDIVQVACPQLNTAGVQTHNYVIQHLAFKDLIDPYDALLQVNKFAQWHLGVWENRTLHFRPYDLTEYVWEVRTDDPGTTFDWQGPSTESLFNGVIVEYVDLLTGIQNTVTPATDAALADSSDDNPWNRAGIPHWHKITLSQPVLRADAVQLGRIGLADANRPKTPGTITVQGYIRDRSGNPQPVWKVRAGDTISITNFPNDTPRLIVETDYDDERKQIRLAIDRPFQLLEALLDRQQNALTAAGLA